MRVVVAGGGVAALEALMALADAGRPGLQVDLVAPEDRFVLRALSVGEPFHRAQAPSVPLADVARQFGATFRRDAVRGVDAEAQTVLLRSGQLARYDALLLAVGARPVPPFPGGVTFAGSADDVAAVGALMRDLVAGRIARVGFVVPAPASWPVALYELALMLAGRSGAGRVVLVTPEPAPLALFGATASRAVADLVERAGVALHVGADPVVSEDGRSIGVRRDGPRLTVDGVVTLPVLRGPRLPGVPHDDEGFIPVDEHGRVLGLDRVFAAGDGTDHPIKQGGLAAQQADAAAAQLLADAAGTGEAPPFRPVLRGRLMTGGLDRFLARPDDDPEDVAVSGLWWPPTKVDGRHLTAWLASQEALRTLTRPPAGGLPVERRLPARLDPSVLGLTPYD